MFHVKALFFVAHCNMFHPFEQQYDKKLLAKEKIRLYRQTNMVDILEEEYSKFEDDEEMSAEKLSLQSSWDVKRDEILHQMDNPPEHVVHLNAFFEDEEKVKSVKDFPTTENLNSNDITIEKLEGYYKYSKFMYDCGQYEEAEAMLDKYVSIAQPLWGPQHSTVLAGTNIGSVFSKRI